MKRLIGVLGPVTTPFDPSSGTVSAGRLRENIAAHLAQGLAGVLVGGSSGEAPLLTESERDVIVEAARSVVPDNSWLLAGIGGESTSLTIDRAKRAGAIGADAVLCYPAHYFAEQMTVAALAGHYRRVADASPVPLLLYNIPKFTHIVLDPAMVHDLAGHGNILGMKDSAGDLDRLAKYLEAQSPRFSVLTGNGATFAGALELGVRGAVLAVSLFAPGITLELWEAAALGDRPAAIAGQQRLMPLAREIAGALGPAGIKAALDLVGLHGGPVRPPLVPLDEVKRARVSAMLHEAGVPAVV